MPNKSWIMDERARAAGIADGIGSVWPTLKNGREPSRGYPVIECRHSQAQEEEEEEEEEE
ncbi:hypothetical protein ColKHC_00826 [Colletotrichum higginsianum]|nr:hypothetical protein ColKHC_00826 [Colletotrichum higginsianum]